LIGGLAILALLATSPARADLTGDNINGMLNFRMLNEGPDQFSQPSGTAPTTFQFADASNVDTATFTANPLTVEDQITDIGCGGGMSFTDTSNALPSLTLVSTGFPTNSLTYALTGDTITPGFAGALGPADFIAVFDIGTNAPEPGSLALFGAGLIGVEVTRRRRFGSTRRQ
jgi:hypothetical protein